MDYTIPFSLSSYRPCLNSLINIPRRPVVLPMSPITVLIQIFPLGKPQKKVLLLMAGPLRQTPPPRPLLELNGRWYVGTLEKRFQKRFFFLNDPAL